MSQIVWIARHGNRLDFVNPEWFNTAPRRYDPPLSEDGLVQAKELGQRLKKENISHIFASPFLRTIQTANQVAQVLNLSIKLEAGLSEWHNPQWMSEMPETHPPDYLAEQFTLIDWNYRSCIMPKYPETETEVNYRTGETVRQLVKGFSDDILIVGHGASVLGTTRGLVADTPNIKIALCCLTKIIQSDRSWELEIFADTSHLSQTETQIRFN